MMEQHFVTFFSPGTFVAKKSARPIESWDTKIAMSMAGEIFERYSARPYGFRFSTRTREDNELDSKVSARSPMYYLGGKIETVEEVAARNDQKERILLANMRGNGYDRARLDKTLAAIAEAFEIAAKATATDALEHLANYMDGCDAVQEEDVAAFKRYRAVRVLPDLIWLARELREFVLYRRQMPLESTFFGFAERARILVTYVDQGGPRP